MKKPDIAVIDYGMGNLRSVAKALELVGASVTVTDDPAKVLAADAAVFPGVGSFGPAVKNIKSRKMIDAIKETIEQKKPFLGVCLGFQLIFSVSEEEGRHRGLDIVPGDVVRFSFSARNAGLKVPHMGWNRVSVQKSGQGMFKGIPDGSYFYFVHSYYARPKSRAVVAGKSNYGIDFCAAVVKDRLWACQFHPEKSGEVGLKLLKNFVNEVKKTC